MTDQHANVGRQAVVGTGISGQIEASEGTAPSYNVNGEDLRRRANSATPATGTQLSRTCTAHGITQHELRRLSGAMHFLRGRYELWTCAIGDNALDVENEATCKLADEVKSLLVRHQDRASLPLYWIEVIEVSPHRHSHLVFVGSKKIGDALHAAFPSLFASGVSRGEAIQPVYDQLGLVAYFSKERTTQASVSLGLPRKRGSYRLEGLGDRVKLSRDLKRDAIEAGLVAPWKATNTSRKPRIEDRRPLHSGRRATPKPDAASFFPSPAMVAPVADVGAIQLTGQLELFPKVAPARLRVYQGGLMPAAVAMETRHLQKCRGLSQQELANRIGISRPQLANGLQGRFPLSGWASARLREFLLEREVA